MYSVSDEYLATIRSSHVRSLRANLFLVDVVVYEEIPLKLGDCSITVDRSQHIRRSGAVTVADPDFWNSIKTNAGVIPYGAELQVEAGISTGAFNFEWVPVGMFQIEGAEADEANGYITTLELADRGKIIERNNFVAPVDYSGWRALDALEDLVTIPPNSWGVTFDPTLSDPVIPGGTIFDGSRWDAIEKVLAMVDAEAYFDVNGDFNIVKTVEINPSATVSEAVWSIDAVGSDEVTNMSNAHRTLSREGVYNAFVVIGGAKDNASPPMGYAEDTEPGSPTNVSGPFGISVAPTETNDLLTTVGQCNQAAQRKLKLAKGIARSVQFECIENDALDVADMIVMRFTDGSEEIHLVQSLSLDFSGKMSGTTTTRQF